MHFQFKETDSLKIKGWENIYQVNTENKKAEIGILISNKRDFKMKNVTQSKDYFIVMKE